MANPEHIKWLVEGVEAWNRRRKDTDFKPDLSGEDIHSEFHEAGLIKPQWQLPLANINLSNSVLRHTHLAHANLTGADFTNALLKNTDLTNADLTCANLAGADLEDAILTNANLTKADLTDAVLVNTNLTKANLTSADLTEANLVDANLTGAILANAKPWKAYLYYTTKKMVSKPNKVVKTAVKTVDDLLEIIREYEEYYRKDSQKPHDSDEIVLYFRGEPKCYRELRPSVMRTHQDERGDSEREMLRDLISRQPDAFSGMTSALSQWMLAQHHSLPTRFLDVTKNPLTALFFACEQEDKYDGVLHIFAVRRSLIKPFDSDIVSVISNFAKLSLHEQELLLGRPSPPNNSHRSQRNYSEAMRQLYQSIRVEKAYFDEWIDPKDFYRVFVVEPQQSFERIRTQSGAFIASAFHERFERDEMLKWNSEIPAYAHFMPIIPSKQKCGLMKDLQRLNITRETLFPGLDESARAVKNFHLNRGALQ